MLYFTKDKHIKLCIIHKLIYNVTFDNIQKIRKQFGYRQTYMQKLNYLAIITNHTISLIQALSHHSAHTGTLTSFIFQRDIIIFPDKHSNFTSFAC